MPGENLTGLIFDVQGHSVHDGPGCRTLVFMAGCPLRCGWCSNPEGLRARPQVLLRARLCQACPTRCVDACPHGAVRALTTAPQDEASRLERAAPLVTIDRMGCAECTTFDCVGVCYRQALQVSGREWTVDGLMRVLSRDQQFWGAEGGVTFSGGEPLAQPDFLLAILARCRSQSMHTALETSGAVPSSVLAEALPMLSWVFLDLKHIDSHRHLEGTSLPNDQVLANLRLVVESGWPGRLVIRTTIVPGFNDDLDQVTKAAAFLSGLGVGEVNLLPFHRMGTTKYEHLGMSYPFRDVAAPTSERMESLANVYRSAGLVCHVGAETPF